MKRSARFVALLLACLACILPSAAQDLSVGERIAATLEPSSRHTYTVHAPKDFFVYEVVNQLTVDVVVRILGPERTQVARFDSPARGPESFQFSPTASGT